jgi:general stress protein YciG
MSMFKERRGFAAMSKAKQAAISSLGGKAAHVKGTAHQFDSLEARQAGRLGGEAIARDRYHMAEIGRRGGIARAKNAARKAKEAATHPLAEGTYMGEVQAIDRTKQGRAEVEIRVMEIASDARKAPIGIPVLRRHDLPKE